MFLRRIFVVLLCGLIAGGGVIYTTTFRFFDRPLTEAKQEKFQEKISLPDNFTLAASVNSIDTVKNTLESAQKNVRDGAFALELNVTFSPAGTLYLADGPEYLTSASVKLETVFKEFRDSTYLRYILNLKNHTDEPKLVDLAVKYDLLGRIMVSGFTPEDLAEHRSQYNNFMVCVRIDPGSVRMNNRDACRELLRTCRRNGAGAVSCPLGSVTETFRKAVRDVGRLRFVLEDVDSEYEMYHALSLNPNIVITAHPENLYSMMLSEDYLDLNKANTF